ncbi:ABC transporter substrate-binding protein [Pseudonocardia nantongensis]|uniref:ABC transporter substrate-binding protein n=1 Tax=Pseudonocardia nantongensis TaxID=1181885 RepID=UPI00397ACF75
MRSPLIHRPARRRVALPAALLALLLLSTACGAGTGALPQADPGPVPCPPVAQGYDRDAELTWIYSVDNTSFDPDTITSNNSQMYLYPVYDSLVHLNEQGRVEPMLAESWTLSPDGRSVTMRLIDDWTYHDGAPFDAESVRANLLRHRDMEGSFNANRLESLVDVQVLDERTVRLVTDSSAGPLVSVLGGSAGMMMSPAVFDQPGQDIAPTGGSGPYRMTGYVPGDRVEYTRVPGYWDPEAAKVAKMTYLISGDDNARLNAVTTGAADVTFLRASMLRAAQESGMVICQQPSLSLYTMNLNTSRSEFGNQKVRQAMTTAIDRRSISLLVSGLCQPTGQMFPDFYYAASPNVKPPAYDPERARALLAEAGLPDGFSFELEVVNLDVYQQIAQVIQANFAEVGIEMSITPVDLSTLAENFSVAKSADAILFEQKAESDPSVATAEYYRPDGFNNPGGFRDPEILAAEDAASRGATPDERAPAYTRLFDAVAQAQAPHIPLCNLTTPFVQRPDVGGVEIYADAARQLRGVAVNGPRP